MTYAFHDIRHYKVTFFRSLSFGLWSKSCIASFMAIPANLTYAALLFLFAMFGDNRWNFLSCSGKSLEEIRCKIRQWSKMETRASLYGKSEAAIGSDLKRQHGDLRNPIFWVKMLNGPPERRKIWQKSGWAGMEISTHYKLGMGACARSLSYKSYSRLTRLFA